MDPPTTPRDGKPTGMRSLLRSGAVQTLLAFGAVIVMLVVFSATAR